MKTWGRVCSAPVHPSWKRALSSTLYLFRRPSPKWEYTAAMAHCRSKVVISRGNHRTARSLELQIWATRSRRKGHPNQIDPYKRKVWTTTLKVEKVPTRDSDESASHHCDKFKDRECWLLIQRKPEESSSQKKNALRLHNSNRSQQLQWNEIRF
jgi:hypothetical protein